MTHSLLHCDPSLYQPEAGPRHSCLEPPQIPLPRTLSFLFPLNPSFSSTCCWVELFLPEGLGVTVLTAWNPPVCTGPHFLANRNQSPSSQPSCSPSVYSEELISVSLP